MAEELSQKWREWVPLTAVLEQLPLRFQQGVDTANLEVTCISSLTKHLILGTNVGLVYLAHLPTPSLMRLKCENPLTPITHVDTVSTVDEMIAAGSLDGTITIFQLPRFPNLKASVSSEPLDFRGSTLPQPVIKRFTVGNIHRTGITSLTWSRNGMRLFCGDAQGVVSQIDINYQTSECIAKELLKEKEKILQLSYSTQNLAVSTLERTLIYSLSDGSTRQVGKKPRKHPGVFGCVWHTLTSSTGCFLYTSRPGFRMWSADAEGEVQQTHIVKELPQNGEMELLQPSQEKPRKGEYYTFGILHSCGSYLVTHNSHWLFLLNLETSQIVSYCGQFGRIVDVAVSESEIFVLRGSRQITCLSIESPEIGERKPLPSLSAGIFLESENLKELKSRIVSQGSGFLGQIARMGSSVAAKVTEHAKPTIVSGHTVKMPSQSTSRLEDEDPTAKPNTTMSSVPTNTSDGREHGHQRSSSSGLLPDQQQRSYSPSLIPPRMVQSVSSLFPSLLSTTPSLVKTFGNTPPFNDITIPVEPHVQRDFEEVVTSSQIVAQDSSDLEPLVLRDKPKKKLKKKQEASSPGECASINTSTLSTSSALSSNPSASSSPSCATPVSSVSNGKSSPGKDEFLEEVSLQLSNKAEEDRSDIVGSNILVMDDPSESTTLHLEGLGPLSGDTRTYEDFKNDIEKKESLLAEILDLGCLKMDHEAKSKEEKGTGEDHIDNLVFQREQSVESAGCSTPSTLKEQSPLPESASSDFLDQYYRNNTSLTSTDGSAETCNEKKEGSNDDNSSLASNDGCERLGSNFSEDRLSCLSYGPPSGSSLVSLPGNRVPSMEGHDLCSSESNAMFIVTDFSDIADISWSYSTTQVQDSHHYDQEAMPGGWVRHKLPSNVISFSVSERLVAFLDSYGCLFCKRNSSDSSWKKFKLASKATHIVQSPSGLVMWVLYGTNAYTVQVPSIEALPTAKMTLAARNVLQLSVDEDLTWYIRGDYQICTLPTKGNLVPSRISCEDFRLVKVVCYSKVVWGLTDKGQLAFRIGMTTPSETGHAWGLMKTPCHPLVDIALGPGCWGWIIDSEGNIFFRLGVRAEYPQGRDLDWWQVVTSDYMMEQGSDDPSNVMLRSSVEGLWLTEVGSNCVFLHNSDWEGHVWNTFSNDTWSTICAEGVYTDQGAICCLSPKGQLFVINPNTKCSVPLEVVNNECIVSVSQRPEAMWVLTAAGDVFIRVGLSAQSLLGTRWEQLDLHQISDVHLCHLSCGTEVVWGVDTRGGVYMRQGPLTPPPQESLPPAWIQVDPTPLKGNAFFTKVYVGMKTYMVWAVDSSRRVYVREAIFPEIPIGISWVLVPGLHALQLSISENEVFALTLNGEIFKRTGVTDLNYIGDTWQKIPGNLARISVTTDNCLWGLNSNGHICQHVMLTSTDLPSDKPEPTHEVFLSDGSEEWEVL